MEYYVVFFEIVNFFYVINSFVVNKIQYFINNREVMLVYLYILFYDMYMDDLFKRKNYNCLYQSIRKFIKAMSK